MFDSLSGPMRTLLARSGILLCGLAAGLAVYTLDVGGDVAVPLAVVCVIVIGELVMFAVGEGP